MIYYGFVGNEVILLKYIVKKNNEIISQFSNFEDATEFASSNKGIVETVDISGYEWLNGLDVGNRKDKYAFVDNLISNGIVVLQDEKQEYNKQLLKQWLELHPLQWTDGKYYGVTEEDQQEMALNLMQYQVSIQSEIPSTLEWHEQKKSCRTFTQEEFVSLALAIKTYVYPYLRYQESIKEKIYNTTTLEELNSININYEDV